MVDTRYRYLSLDSDWDLSVEDLEVSVDRETWTPIDHSEPPAQAAGLPEPAGGMTRYWWRVLIGPGQELDPAPGQDLIYGRLSDTPEEFYPVWPLGEDTSAAPGFVDDCWPVIIPEASRSSWDKLTAQVQEQAKAQAVATLRQLTAWAVGGCPVTIRPCRRSAGERTWATYPVAGGPRGSFYPVLASGRWLNIGCGCTRSCGCTSTKTLRLRPPASQVTEIWVDGALLPSSAYYLDGLNLIRVDGGTWPLTQDMTAGDHDAGAFAVTYIPGYQVDGQGAYAAGVLAVEYSKAALGQKCRLPKGTTQVARQGVSMTLVTDQFPDGLTGIEEADSFVRRWNPNQLTIIPSVWSPDLPAAHL